MDVTAVGNANVERDMWPSKVVERIPTVIVS